MPSSICGDSRVSFDTGFAAVTLLHEILERTPARPGWDGNGSLTRSSSNTNILDTAAAHPSPPAALALLGRGAAADPSDGVPRDAVAVTLPLVASSAHRVWAD